MGAAAVFFAEHDGFVDTPIYRWEDLVPGATIAAPAIVEGAATSIVVPPGWSAAVDSMRNIIPRHLTRFPVSFLTPVPDPLLTRF